MGDSIGGALALVVMIASGAAAASAGFDGVRGWGPLAIGMDLAQARERLGRAGIAYQERFVMKDGTTRITLAGEEGAGVCYFDGERRLTQISFTGPQAGDQAAAAVAEARARRRFGPPGESRTVAASDGTREERVLSWRNAAVELTVTVAHSLPDGEWVVFEVYARAE